jgi:ATP-binding protein involved in chromosome partitioning
LSVPLFGQVPIEPALREGGDSGVPIVVRDPDSPAGTVLREAARSIAQATRTKVGKPLPLMAMPGAVAAGGHAGHAH